MKFHVKKIILIFLIIQSFLSLNLIYTNKLNIDNNLTASVDFGGYTEDQFYPIYVYPENITIGDIVLEVSGSLVSSIANITYPVTNNTWKIIFPEDFGDVQDLYIRRSYLEYYYPQDNEDSRITYWIMSGSPSINDTINFNVIAPTPEFSNNFFDSNLTYKSYYLSISRFDESNRPYSNVKFRHEMTAQFTGFTYEIWNLTGGINENITDESNFDYYFITTGTGVHIVFEMDIGNIKNKTDYLFEVILIKNREIVKDYLGMILYGVAGFIVGLALFPLILGYIFRIAEWRGRRKPKRIDYIKYGIPTGLVIGIIIAVIFYFI